VLASQVEVAVAKAQLFVGLHVLVDLERRGFGARQDVDVESGDLHLAGPDLRVDRPFPAGLDLAGDLDAELAAELLRGVVRGLRHLRVEDHLHETGGVAQVDEGHAAVIASAMDPPA
jgi:hypothetical protein